jgi:hypothetical protein
LRASFSCPPPHFSSSSSGRCVLGILYVMYVCEALSY